MAYSTSPFLPRARMEAVNLVRLKGYGVRAAARRTGVSPGTIVKWIARAPQKGSAGIPTRSSRPHTSPNRIAPEVEERICALRKESGRCGQVVFEMCKAKGITVSVNTVQRVLARHGYLKRRSPWKRFHAHTERPSPALPGDLVELDTIHLHTRPGIFYVYTLIDVCSRWAHAWVAARIRTHASVRFVHEAQQNAAFPFQMLQTDHGSEFSTWFTEHAGVAHRHTRLGKPNDNAHIERWNRTLQEECLDRLPRVERIYRRELPEYLRYYNGKRMHMGISYKTPEQKVAELFPRSWG